MDDSLQSRDLIDLAILRLQSNIPEIAIIVIPNKNATF